MLNKIFLQDLLYLFYEHSCFLPSFYDSKSCLNLIFKLTTFEVYASVWHNYDINLLCCQQARMSHHRAQLTTHLSAQKVIHSVLVLFSCWEEQRGWVHNTADYSDLTSHPPREDTSSFLSQAAPSLKTLHPERRLCLIIGENHHNHQSPAYFAARSIQAAADVITVC